MKKLPTIGAACLAVAFAAASPASLLAADIVAAGVAAVASTVAAWAEVDFAVEAPV
jgi:hypothetical protein